MGKADEAKAVTEKERSGIEVGKADGAKAITRGSEAESRWARRMRRKPSPRGCEADINCKICRKNRRSRIFRRNVMGSSR